MGYIVRFQVQSTSHRRVFVDSTLSIVAEIVFASRSNQIFTRPSDDSLDLRAIVQATESKFMQMRLCRQRLLVRFQLARDRDVAKLRNEFQRTILDQEKRSIRRVLRRLESF